MQVSLINQPFQGAGQRVGDHLIRLLARNTDFDHFRLAVAWARSGGVQPLFGAMQQFRKNGSRIEAVVGIDLKGTSIQGLELLQQLAHSVTIFQNANRHFRPTYHPKLYVLSGPRAAIVILGSSNLTQGGLFINYEQNLLVEMDLRSEDDQKVLAGVLAGYEASANAPNGVARALTPEFLKKLIERELLVDEASPAAQHSRSGDQDNDETKAVEAPLFGTMDVPPPPASARKPTRPKVHAPTAPARPETAGPARPSAAVPSSSTGVAAAEVPELLTMRPYPQRGGTQIQVPQGLETTFFRGIKYVESQHDGRHRPISPARTKSRSGSRLGRVVNTLKLEIPEFKGMSVPIIQFQKTDGGIKYTAFDGAKDMQGKLLLASLESGMASGVTKRTRQDSTMWVEH